MIKNEFDEYCNKIFAFMILIDKPINFTNLYNGLNKNNYKISRPTLTEHLKHLLKQKIIKRKKETKKTYHIPEVIYSINYELTAYKNIPAELKELTKAIQEQAEMKKENEFFNKLNITEKTAYVTNMLFIIELYYLKMEIRTTFEPEKQFEAYLTFMFIKNWLQRFRINMLQNCLTSKEDAKKALEEVEKIEQTLRNIIFSKTPN